MEENFTYRGNEANRYFDILEGLSSFHKQFNYDDNDRAIVIVGIAYVEDLLHYCLENFFPSGTKTVQRMLSHTGFVGTFSSKTDLLYSLGLIDKVIKGDLDKLAQIRNEFAHKTAVSFEDEKIENLIKELKWHEIFMMMKAPKEATVKEIFKVGVNTIVTHLNGIASVCKSEKRKLKEWK